MRAITSDRKQRNGGVRHAPYAKDRTNYQKPHSHKATGPNNVPVGNNNQYEKLRIKKQYKKIVEREFPQPQQDLAPPPEQDQPARPRASLSRPPTFTQIIEERERRQKDRADDEARKKQEREERDRRKQDYQKKRETERKQLLKRTKHGQPVMSSMVDKLLSKILHS
ncbi:hypothetical protein SeMB42_g00025 [Synchytrium endobioticum]|uniref:rRNA-processing protein FYV7 n=1 Tax=Synchytrium endobioticum TaxID=286115 RepID=A0A507DTB3_9FUNG|nr:hypothetical protein SeLEV6574_g02051 [Synchytrium endobioticum]TPX54989.1 hypothetical protein SeMB42_g00025 [Synchytrium endobioticum]